MFHRLQLIFLILCCYYYVIFCDNSEPKPASSEKKHSVNPARLKAEGNAAFENRDYNKALKYFEQLVEVQPDHYENWHLKGLVHLLKDNYRAAIDDWTHCLELSTEFIDGYYYRGKAYKKIGECEKALTDLTKAQKLDNKNSDKYKNMIIESHKCIENYEKAMNYLKKNECNAAEPIIEELLQISPYDSKLNFGITNCHFSQKNYQSVLKYTGNILRENPQNLEALLLRGQSYYYIGEFEMAKKHYSVALKSDPDHKIIKEEWKKLKTLLRHIENANAEYDEKKWADALQDYTKALELDENLHVIHKDIKLKRCKTAANYNKIDNKQRIQYCDEALQEHNNDHAEAFYWRGKIYKDIKDWDQAARDFEAAVQRDRQNGQYHEELRSVRFEEKKAKRKDYYAILGITQDASAREIKKAFRKCGMEHHPDQHANASDEDKQKHEDIFKACVEASDILSDPETKAKYDRGEDVLEQMQGGNRGGGGFHGGFPGGFPFNFAGGGGGGQRFTFRFG